MGGGINVMGGEITNQVVAAVHGLRCPKSVFQSEQDAFFTGHAVRRKPCQHLTSCSSKDIASNISRRTIETLTIFLYLKVQFRQKYPFVCKETPRDGKKTSRDYRQTSRDGKKTSRDYRQTSHVSLQTMFVGKQTRRVN
jgi:hypothetical protein